MITFHTKKVSQADLIHLLWPGSSPSPSTENSLKTCLHRTKILLDKLEYPDAIWIINNQGSYQWNLQLPFHLDAIEFEDHYFKASNTSFSMTTRLSHYRKAFELFKGDYLSNSPEAKLFEQISSYYHTIYLRLVHELINFLHDSQNHEEIIYICCKAISLEPYDELLYFHLIYSLCKLGKVTAAKEQYIYIMQYFHNQPGIQPSKSLIDLYKEILKQEVQPLKSNLLFCDSACASVF